MDDIVNLGDIIRREPADHPLVTDLRDPSQPQTLTLGQVRRHVAAVARGLLALGYASGDRIAIVSANRWEFLASYFGIMSAGMVAVPVNFRLSQETIAFILADAGVRAAIVDREREAMIPPGVPRFTVDGDGSGSFGALLDPGPFDAVQPTAGQLAKILYTSGSTGRPKGVPLTHGGQLWALRKSFTGGDAALFLKTTLRRGFF